MFVQVNVLFRGAKPRQTSTSFKPIHFKTYLL
nr:MAG TPA: hypothetical protein [Caudoviricetes sp.]DAS13707.1 MAG TPA: hypothetical protein [Caudoviricetes sp.]